MVVGWNIEGDISLEANEKLALLFARLLYVFDMIDEEITKREDYEDFVDTLKGIRIKQTLKDNNFSLAKAAEIILEIYEADDVKFVINCDDEDVVRAIMAFGKCIGDVEFEFLKDKFEFYLV